jgi:hypothetical protein
MRGRFLLTACLLCAIPAAAASQGPEQLDQLEPGLGEWQAEYFATIGRRGQGAHAIEAMWGVSGRLAVGFEVEAEYEDGALAFETLGAKALYRITRDGAPVAMGVQLQLGFDSDARLAEAEARLILEAQSESWWAQGNLMMRRSSDDQGGVAHFAYAFSLQHALAEFAWFGVEASGQSAPLWGDAGRPAEDGHFAGPSLTFEWEPLRGRELEIGIAYLHRLQGEGAGATGRIFAQLTF